MIATPSRHDRVWLDPATWRDHLRSDLRVDLQIAERSTVVDDWVRRGRALVTRRRDAGIDDAACCLGIALPLALGRSRIALVIDRAALCRVAAPLGLDAIIDAAPTGRRAALRDLRRRADELDTALAVYGSFAWQAISGEACVTPTSDLDVLWNARADDQVAAMIDALLTWERGSGLRADGEVRFADGDAVAWRELATDTSTVLVKRDDGVALRPRPTCATPRG